VSDRPLAGRRILVTRAVHQAGKLSDALRQLGAEPVEVPVLKIVPPASFAPLDQALRQLDTYNWLILTSANAVRAIVERASHQQIPTIPIPASVKVAAVGESTASAARAAGIQVTFVPESYVAESLVLGVLERFAGWRILIARAAIARDVIPDALRAAGAQVDVVDAYQNVLPESAPLLLREALTQPIDAATFTSSSTVTHLAEAAQIAGIAFPFLSVPAISIGPITSQTLREFNWPPAVEAAPHDIPSLVAAVSRVFSHDAGPRSPRPLIPDP
jgi:uroporphyrinogen-III synthase